LNCYSDVSNKMLWGMALLCEFCLNYFKDCISEHSEIRYDDGLRCALVAFLNHHVDFTHLINLLILIDL
jgi:hypothetical protein